MRRKLFPFIIALTLTAMMCRESGVYSDKPGGASNDEPAEEPPFEIKLVALELTGAAIDPPFSSGIYSYSAGITSGRSEVTITAVPADGGSVRINETVTDPSCHCLNVPVGYGDNSIPVYVDYAGVEGVIYTLNIYRMMELTVGNPSFEVFDANSHPVSWSMKGSGECIVSSDYFHSGLNSATFKTLTTSISGREIISEPVGIAGGRGILLSAWFYVPAADGSSPERVSVSFKVYYYSDSACTVPASDPYHTMQKVSLAEQGVWQRIDYTRTADKVPADAKYACIAVRACYNSGSGGTKNEKIYFDDLSIEQ